MVGVETTPARTPAAVSSSTPTSGALEAMHAENFAGSRPTEDAIWASLAGAKPPWFSPAWAA